MAATIYDVAALAGVSIKSVSRVLNREPNVSAALQAKVQAAVESLDYRPNLSARTLAGASSYLIAAFVDAELTLEHWRSGRGNDYLSRLEFGALVECRKAGYHLLVELVDYGSPSLEARLVSLLRALRPDGVLLTPPNSDDPLVLDILERAGTPFVRLGAEQDLGRGMRVFMDDRQAAADMTTHLIALGHRRIALVAGPAAYAASQARREGFLAALAEHDLTVEPDLLIEGDFTFESGRRAGETLLKRPNRPTAIFASNDDMALGVLNAAAALGVAVPGGVSVCGFDDTPSSMLSTPPLTTIRQPVAEMAATATRMLLAGARGQKVEAEQVPYALVERLSARALV
ncbi:MAG: LacI family transcriptional regulator [Brevundimonas sp.]|uniref:LacI family DNA-binding transcriptional regulator n=1 Tax=Brevundimonas sp. TaxID=1871086 RepID=UPI000DB40006|nr:LacI family DNA-binding transcriptional regulator [Brevundimonas sp.]PZU72272.1 MAG: LacI family transcriptional regulator [Brevundimonas sp.]